MPEPVCLICGGKDVVTVWHTDGRVTFVCKACGQTKEVIGYDISEQLDVEPAKYFVVVTKREKRACKHCEEGGIAAAPAPARIIDEGLVSDGS